MRTLIAVFLIALLVGWLFSSLLQAEEADLPKAEKVLAGYVEATGGQAAYDKVKNRYVESLLEMKDQGIKMTIKVWSEKPNKIYTLSESDMMGETVKGSDGKVVWEKSMMTGPVIKKGKERHDSMIMQIFDRIVYWEKGYKMAECVGEEEVNGAPCYKVMLHPLDYVPEEEGAEIKEDEPHVAFFNKETRLLDRLDLTITTPMGSMPLKSYFGEYKKVDDLLQPHKLTISVMGMEREINTLKIEQNMEMADDRFKLPEEITNLLEKEKPAKIRKEG